MLQVPPVRNAEPGWMAGEIRGHTGWFPESYVEPVDTGTTVLDNEHTFIQQDSVEKRTLEWVIFISNIKKLFRISLYILELFISITQRNSGSSRKRIRRGIIRWRSSGSGNYYTYYRIRYILRHTGNHFVSIPTYCGGTSFLWKRRDYLCFWAAGYYLY